MRTHRIRIDASLDDTHATLYNVRGEVIARVLREDLQATRHQRYADETIRLDPNDPWTPAINRMAGSADAKPIRNAVSPWHRKVGIWMTTLNTRYKYQRIHDVRQGEARINSKTWPDAIVRMWQRAKNVYDAASRQTVWGRWAATVSSNHNHKAKARAAHAKRNTQANSVAS